MTGIRLFASKFSGSAIAESCLTLAGIDYDIVEIPYDKAGPELARLKPVNPLGQLPALELPDGRVMTETAAIALYVSELAPQAGLAPPPEDPLRVDFLRWLVFLVANIYPTFTYGDFPARWVEDPSEQARFRSRTDERREELWKIVDKSFAAFAGPWALGARFSALDLYVWVMTHWRPRRAWFSENCPELFDIARRLDADPRLTEVWMRNFADPAAE